MRRLIVNREMELTPGSALKMDEFFELIRNFIEQDSIRKKDIVQLSFSREEKLKLYKFLAPMGNFPMNRQVNLNESMDETPFVGPFQIMDLLRKHR